MASDRSSGAQLVGLVLLALARSSRPLVARLAARISPLAAGLAVFLVAAGTSLPAAAQTRALKLYNTHTGETATVVFKRNGQFDPAGLKQLNHMLRDWRRDEPTRMAPELFDLIYEVYAEVGATEPIHIISGYRSPVTNNMLRSRSRGVAKLSQHMLGKAMDFFIPGVSLSRLREAGLRKQFGGVGFYPTSGSPFVHMDVGSVRHWPRMTREQLARVFPDGKTVHLPADGPPLSRYQEALAEVERYKGRNAVPAGGDDDDDAPSGKGRGDDAPSGDGGLLAGLFGFGRKPDEPKAPPQVAARVQPRPAARPIDDDTPPGLAPPAAAAAQPARPASQVASLAPPAEPLPLPVSRPAAPPPLATQPPVPATPAPGAIIALPAPRGADAAATQPAGWTVGPPPTPAAAPAPPAVAPAAPPPEPSYQVATGLPLPKPRPGAVPPPLQAVAAVNSVAGDPPVPQPPATAFAYAAPGLPVPAARPTQVDGTASASGMAMPPAASAASAQLLPPPLAPIGAGLPLPPARPPQQVAALVPDAAAPRPAAPPREARPAGLARGADALQRLTNRVAAIPPARLLDGNATLRQKSFARLSHPDQDGLPQLIGKPRAAIAQGFSRDPSGGLRTDGFTGLAIARLPVVKVE